MNKKGFLLAEETLKIIIALISLGFLVYFLGALYFANQDSKELEQAKASLEFLVKEINDGRKEVTIFNKKVHVRAKIVNLRSYSAHKDSDNLIEFVSHTADKVKKVFVVMGETKASLFLVQRLRDYLGVDAVAPEQGESVELE